MATMTGPLPAVTGEFAPGGEHPYPEPAGYGLPLRHPEALFERMVAERAPTRQQPALTPEAERELLANRQQAPAPVNDPALLEDRQSAIAAGERDRARVQPPAPEVLERALRGLRNSAFEDAVIPDVPDTPAELLAEAPAPAGPCPDDGGWLRDLLAEGLRALAGTRDALVLVCGTCKDDGAPCARHALRVREASRAWELSEEVGRALTSRDALLYLLVQAERSIAGD